MAFAKTIKFTNNNICELQAALHQMEWCEDNFNAHITLEMDSLKEVNIIKSLLQSTRTLKKIVYKIEGKVRNLQCEVIHCFREANAVADSLPRYSITGDIYEKYSREEDMPNTTR
ncbi:hypothetical protein MTR67_048553 [Solanum verrucosum]|uniref:RNase H type-1 domain-containing protein n=1 Tax=Solanum verrucosum TaxID=315347 RepID=A0AAF0V1P4_SOLVR|nr:hypothetical protein MTR67_048553 [Solanum verrucosum]